MFHRRFHFDLGYGSAVRPGAGANRGSPDKRGRLVGGDDGTRTHDPLLAKQVL